MQDIPSIARAACGLFLCFNVQLDVTCNFVRNSSSLMGSHLLEFFERKQSRKK